ncbi:MAG: sterol desaturase family protein [Alphaproteobacteria bacterium]|nr:sterol desaturase family protein [Alphaproteobacteria bacterium]
MSEIVTLVQANAFYVALIVFALLELFAPWRRHRVSLAIRWTTNGGLYAMTLLLHRVVLPATAIEVAGSAFAAEHGLLRPLIGSEWLAAAATVLILDACKYAEHVVLHRSALLWRLHLVHHAETEVDFTTAERHHPLETLGSMVLTLAIVGGLGLTAEGILLYAILAVAVTIWSHANLQWPAVLDRTVRAVFVTPGMHFIHHSAWQPQTDSNYGVVFSFWDRIFGTYRAPESERLDEITAGLEYFREPDDMRFLRTLALPFVRDRQAGAPLPDAGRAQPPAGEAAE